MEAGYIIFPIVILFFFILPLAIFFHKQIRKSIRLSLLGIPFVITIAFITYVIIDVNKSKEMNQKFPEINNIIFHNSENDVRDSIFQLKKIMEKLPKRTDHRSASYSLDKHPQRYHSFSFNSFNFDMLENLEQDNNLHNYKITESARSRWTEFVGSDLSPFGVLTQTETKRFISLIKYLDINTLSAANLADNIITFDYNDSLSHKSGFRKITLDTSGYYGPEFFEIIDRKNGFYLLRKK